MKIYTYSIKRTFVKEIETVKTTDAPAAVAHLRQVFDFDREQEQFYVLFLNTSNEIIGTHLSHIGSINSVMAQNRDVFRPALIAGAAAIIIAHNHPSGNTTPSEQDRKFTREAVTAGKLLNIQVLDHLIITETDYYSFSYNGEI